MTLEEDVAARLQAEVRRTGKPVKTVVNEALRRGLDRASEPSPPPFKLEARDLGLKPGFDLDDIEGLIERIEGSGHR